ncbi:drug resistance transporter, EmrB/QacA subfamily [Methanocorpusculum labreanum Z]|uniref:Drug resistance transporter, EmrB/QacA subfamily n=1 Tax=Methanocorpusculum labreanum (strain ATCC 43576 / DSM 4855 / Z) TaxID=410358 RepID=A2ST00_METLZ|nr:DHA2 family efflux MFS transporter permease subunit [Methanocorpusculum labreanum]ABN07456.1 drug resistance transporter, EmrB/QacA subfamily [Methanocorpusculum labreanum Z]
MIQTSSLQQYFLMILASTAVFLDYLDTSIVSIALPTISADLGIGSLTASWVMTSYLLALGSTLLLFGKLADRTGRDREIFIAGFVLFTVSSFLCGVSANIEVLIGFRVIQGIAAGMMVSTATMLITTRLPSGIRGMGMGVIATAGGIALALGPGLGGLVTEFISWHWIFFINVPIGVAAVILAVFLIPGSEIHSVAKQPFDCFGALLLALTLVSLLMGLELVLSDGWTLWVIVLFLIVPIFGYVFFRRELRHPDPVLSAKLFLNRTVMWASLSTLLVTLVYLGIVYLIPFYLTGSIQMSVAAAGLVMLLAPVSMALIGIPAGALSEKIGCMRLCNLAAVLMAGGLVFLVFSVVLSFLPLLFVGLLLLGLGMGLNEGPSMQRITLHCPRELQGSSGGLIFTVMNIGCILGVAVFSAAASLGSGGSDIYTDQGVIAACIAGIIAAVCAYLSSRLARDQILC